MKDKKMKYIICGILVIIGLGIGYFLFSLNDNLVKLDYSELIKKIDNKEDFVLCISRTTCSHCDAYKPKLRKIANKYDIKIYDSNGLLVFNGKTNDYGFIYFEAKNWEVYKIEIGYTDIDKFKYFAKKNNIHISFYFSNSTT